MEKVFFKVVTNAEDMVMEEPVAAVYGADPQQLYAQVRRLQKACQELDLSQARMISDLDWLDEDGDQTSSASQEVVVTRHKFWFQRYNENSRITFWTMPTSLDELDRQAQIATGNRFCAGDLVSKAFMEGEFRESLEYYMERLDFHLYAANIISRIYGRDSSAEVNPEFIDMAFADGLSIGKAVDSWFAD